jgi:glycerol kinase
VWDRSTGKALAPGLGWQDLRTLGDCLVLQGEDLRLAPNQSATKLSHLLDQVDPDRSRDVCFGTVDTWIIWHLTGGASHITDATNAGVTGLVDIHGEWDDRVLEALRIPRSVLPTIVDSCGELAVASTLDGSPPITGVAGDQQASLVGQGCVDPGSAKVTFGTGGMLDVVVGPSRPTFEIRGAAGTFPIITSRRGGEITWGLEAIMLSAGTNVEWLRDDLGIIDTVDASHDVAIQCETTDGVSYVPALLGLGTPHWDYGARGTLLGLTRGSGRPEIVRAVLEGIAHRGTDLLEATESDSGVSIGNLRVDGGMSRNPTFVQALADSSQRVIEVSPVVEATALGAGLLAGLAIGTWGDWSDIAATWQPAQVVEPGAPLDRERWAKAVERAAGWYGELSALDF